MITYPVRPKGAIERLIAELQPLGKTVDIAARRRLPQMPIAAPVVYLFLQGELSVSRVSDGLLVATVVEPHIFGFSEMFHQMRSNVLRAETPCVLTQVEAKVAEEAIEQRGLWRDVAELLAFHTHTMICRDLQIVNQRTYPIVCHYLRELGALSEETRERVNILSFIQERTGLSRSSILNVISSLKTDRHIDFVRGGYQLRINNLPE
ncbi:MAG: helix-turn-helix domain-containing protein [Scandinavium sp.]|uniref:helix-turn-helix domain-containing protein n=1 Tax=Scandinavium sp. TaxID=2830653 RepID=UPI003F34A42A